MIRECDICGETLSDTEVEKVCAPCQEEMLFDCASCGAELGWRDRAHKFCEECRENVPGVTAVTGKG